ncbi:MAG: methionyl-tRNA formyltransferase [Chitinispirillaceae bacterium]|nr:methionyl-tRNA formyltransferase [Chitinispirillaceae bacterium]
MNIVFLGSSDFGLSAMEKLRGCHTLCAVVTTPPRPRGRGLKCIESPVANYAKTRGIGPILMPEDLGSTELCNRLQAYQADIFVVVAFRILPKKLFSIPRLGTLNVHASLLPRYRGPAPIQRAIEAGEQETGITIFRIDEGIDTGEILMQNRVAIGPQESTPELYARLSSLGSQALLETLSSLETGAIRPIVQDNAIVSRAPKLQKSEARIDWKASPQVIFNKIRAFKPFPGTWTLCDGKRLGILWAEPWASQEAGGEPGFILRSAPDSFDVCCAGGVLRVTQVKPENGRAMPVRDFLLGHSLKQGALLT